MCRFLLKTFSNGDFLISRGILLNILKYIRAPKQFLFSHHYIVLAIDGLKSGCSCILFLNFCRTVWGASATEYEAALRNLYTVNTVQVRSTVNYLLAMTSTRSLKIFVIFPWTVKAERVWRKTIKESLVHF